MRVFVYGDSNSWGTPPDGTGLRMARPWPVVMAEALGAELLQDPLPGRTTVHDDPVMARVAPEGAAWNGSAHLEAALMAASPVDVVLILLGTNDFKARFRPSAEKIAGNILALAGLAARVPAGPGGWNDEVPPKVGVLCPPPLGLLADDPAWERHEEWAGGREVSFWLHTKLGPMAAAQGVPVFEVADVAEASARDPIHLEAESHEALGRAVAAWVRGWA